ncbi:MAG: hypothetical protein HUU38_29745 [Anaerolineales bacterium]|nr:hypothetical protein [Anaerolineales bacterium]
MPTPAERLTLPVLCPEHPTPSPQPAPWISIGNASWHYTFEVPTTWQEIPFPLHPLETRIFYSDRNAYGQPEECAFPNGLMKLEFATNPKSGFEFDREGATETTLAELPAWIKVTENEATLPAGSIITHVFLEGPRFWYTFDLTCTPPTGADEAVQSAYQVACRETLDHILASFQILP